MMLRALLFVFSFILIFYRIGVAIMDHVCCPYHLLHHTLKIIHTASNVAVILYKLGSEFRRFIQFPIAMDVDCPLCIRLAAVLFMHSLLTSSSTAGANNITTDQSALLSLKSRTVSDPYEVMENWTVPSSVCNWIGVTCGKRHNRVIGLNISNMGLAGSIPPELGNLSFLVSIDISKNGFESTLPEDLVRLQRLRFVSFSYNNFTGEVPSWISSLPQLENLSLRNNSFSSINSFLVSTSNQTKLDTLTVSYNPFQGEIPKSIGNLRSLKKLYMVGNGFSGSIPTSIVNISGLETLELSENLIQGMPEAIGNLHMLKWLNLQGNRLDGSIPLIVFNISTLENLSFSRNQLSGTLPGDMCRGVPLLKRLYLSDNMIHGHIPSSISSCTQLQFFSMPHNVLTGSIPKEIGSLEMLQTLYLRSNMLTGLIPSEIGNLHNLQFLSLGDNFLTGTIPSTMSNMSYLNYLSFKRNRLHGFLIDEIGNLTMLTELYLGENNFTGVIPQVYDRLTQLEVLEMGMNSLSGHIPSYIFNLSTLKVISLLGNDFIGNVPEKLSSSLPNLEQLFLGVNHLNGVIPNSFSNFSHLKILDLTYNELTGSIPDNLGYVRSLEVLNLVGNNLISESVSPELKFFTSLMSSRSLTFLAVNDNPLNGTFPTFAGNLSSSLQSFSASGCSIRGFIPNEIGKLSGLVRLNLQGNDLTGTIPSELSKLSNLQELDLGNNSLTGFIPTDICKLERLGRLALGQNRLTGSLPECLGSVSSLRYIDLNSNNLSSEIPPSIWSLKDLSDLDISSNSINGSISPEIGNLKAANTIDLSMNQLSNDIPNTFGGLENVITLSLAYNKFQGPIPDSIGKMLSLNSLDLSHNMLSGTIPKSLESLTQLKSFNVSFNKLSGEIPTEGPFKNLTSRSFAFNTALCGSKRFLVSSCKATRRSNRKKELQIVFVVLGIVALILTGSMIFLITRYYRKKEYPIVSDIFATKKPIRVSYYELLQATNEFSEDNLLGSGSFGSVYKGVLKDGTVLAIKVFKTQMEHESKSFDAECEALRNLRHRNLIKVVGSCSNKDFKALLLEYMPNGSLEKWLYSNYNLDVIQRLNILIDVACAVEYLHHGYSTPVVHCDLKPSNILMDENMVAHVSDFGITKFLGEEGSVTHTRTLATLGYMAPEYGSEGRISTSCDVYSYGIIMLEMFTRKSPCDEMFSGGMNLRSWVKVSHPDVLIQVTDPSLISIEEMNASTVLPCISSVLELAMRCSEDAPSERMNMTDTLAELKKIKLNFMQHYAGPETR
ncbi:probable LRR receptor-like serine/threonine-protein kinase At3g47570 isoform X2 [Andrographis paniculata]|nr:probable LRR receptor-like serine/threonine-protein kinase At3g47570 isoform X2 [Andrographis paniculata]